MKHRLLSNDGRAWHKAFISRSNDRYAVEKWKSTKQKKMGRAFREIACNYLMFFALTIGILLNFYKFEYKSNISRI